MAYSRPSSPSWPPVRSGHGRDTPRKFVARCHQGAIVAALAPPRGSREGAPGPYPHRPSVTDVSGTNRGAYAFVLRHDPYDSGVGIMATDYDAPRRSEADELVEDSLDELKARRNEAQSGAVDVDESESAENFELPGADLSGEELIVRVLPKQADEFTCSSCFLVHHRSRLAEQRNGRMVCRDCAA
jgi:hypothetical protein